MFIHLDWNAPGLDCTRSNYPRVQLPIKNSSLNEMFMEIFAQFIVSAKNRLVSLLAPFLVSTKKELAYNI